MPSLALLSVDYGGSDKLFHTQIEGMDLGDFLNVVAGDDI